ncbi:MAG: hypothetical protein AAB289_14320 [Chloroflexota bacterium]
MIPLADHGAARDSGQWRPMVPAMAAEPFDSPDWLFELKWGGVRALAFIEPDGVRLVGQNGTDLTEGYPELRELRTNLGGRSAVLDGEIVAVGPGGLPDLELLRPRLNSLILRPGPPARRSKLFYQAFDLLRLDDGELLETPLWMRRNQLHACFTPSKVGQVTEFVSTEGAGFFEAVAGLKLEGVLAKQKYSYYRPGHRTTQWLDIPALNVGHYAIGGYSFGGGRKKEAFQSLLLGAYRDGVFTYVGRAAAGMASPEAWLTVRMLEQLHQTECPFAVAPRVDRLVYWCAPRLVCQIKAGEPGPNGALRFAVFTSLRPDIAPEDCILPEIA